MITNWRDISYLVHGTLRQRKAFSCLRDLRILDVLKEFDPVLVSTICLDIDIPASDLDIICEVHDLKLFEALLYRHYGALRDFNMRRSESCLSAVVCQFFTDSFELEVFAQPVPTEQQNAYRHLIQIDRVVSLGGGVVRDAIRALKVGGIKTEPAVAQLLHLDGDPYAAVLALERKSDAEIVARLRSAFSETRGA